VITRWAERLSKNGCDGLTGNVERRPEAAALDAGGSAVVEIPETEGSGQTFGGVDAA